MIGQSRLDIFMNSKLLLLYSIMCIIWGTTWIPIKIGGEHLPPFLFAGVRFLLAAIFMYVILRIQKFPLKLHKNEIKPVFFLSMFMIAVPYAIVNWGVKFTDSAMGAILMCLLPLMIFPISYFMKTDEKLSFKIFLGVLMGLIGTAVIFYPKIISHSPSFKGDIAILISVFIYAFATVYSKKYASHISVRKSVFYQILIAALFLIVTSVIVERPWEYINYLFQWKEILSIIYLAIFGSVITFVIYYWLIKEIGAIASASAIFIEVGLAVFLDWLILSVVPHKNTWIGIALILLGVFMVLVWEREKIKI